jgi:hypothetical protein
VEFSETYQMVIRIEEEWLNDYGERYCMDQLVQWITASGEASETTVSDISFEGMIMSFIHYYRQIWWNTRSDATEFKYTFSPAEHKVNEQQLDLLVDRLIHELKHIPDTEYERLNWESQLSPTIRQFGMEVFDFKPSYFDFIESSGLLVSMKSFVRMAREFDPQISLVDIYQAGRNVVTANLIQLLLRLPVRVTPSLFAYSMLYPYTDNYIDDKSVNLEMKIDFNTRFRRRLMGESIDPANSNESTIIDLIGMIESEWDREKYPQVFDSLLAIHSAQSHSLNLVGPDISPFEQDIVGISIEKGGTSVLTDGFLAAGKLNSDQARVLFGFGAFTQLMDDLEDIQPDIKDQRASLFSLSASKWKLDQLGYKFFNFGHYVINDLSVFSGKDIPMLSEIMLTSIDPMLLNTFAQSSEYFSKTFMGNLERHMPFRFSVLNIQRESLKRKKLDVPRMMELLLL